MPTSRAARLGVAVVVAVAPLLVVLVWHLATRGDRAEVVGRARDGWATIRHRGVEVDLPPSWARGDDGCEFEHEHWAPPGARRCGRGAGLSFYDSATFDAATGPGARRTPRGDGPAWSGYVVRGDVVVFAADDRRRRVERILGSAR
ncbi:MAG: hypothetical protein JWR42_757 [Marmoricola sp.]|nr:hypothetical protein [Marmoricola sp.]